MRNKAWSAEDIALKEVLIELGADPANISHVLGRGLIYRSPPEDLLPVKRDTPPVSELSTILEMLNDYIAASSAPVEVFTDVKGRVRAKVVTEIVI